MTKPKCDIPVKGNPTPRSPVSVSKDPTYEQMVDYEPDAYWPSATSIVFRHKESGTFWMAVYAVREDDSDASLPATWRQVQPRQIMITKYVNVQ